MRLISEMWAINVQAPLEETIVWVELTRFQKQCYKAVLEGTGGKSLEAELEEFMVDFETLMRRVASGEETTIPFPWLIGLLVSSGMSLLGGIGMLKRAWWPVCVSGALATLVPCLGSCCGLFFPIGIWSLIVLYQADTRRGFA